MKECGGKEGICPCTPQVLGISVSINLNSRALGDNLAHLDLSFTSPSSGLPAGAGTFSVIASVMWICCPKLPHPATPPRLTRARPCAQPQKCPYWTCSDRFKETMLRLVERGLLRGQRRDEDGAAWKEKGSECQQQRVRAEQ